MGRVYFLINSKNEVSINKAVAPSPAFYFLCTVHTSADQSEVFSSPREFQMESSRE